MEQDGTDHQFSSKIHPGFVKHWRPKNNSYAKPLGDREGRDVPVEEETAQAATVRGYIRRELLSSFLPLCGKLGKWLCASSSQSSSKSQKPVYAPSIMKGGWGQYQADIRGQYLVLAESVWGDRQHQVQINLWSYCFLPYSPPQGPGPEGFTGNFCEFSMNNLT